MPNQRKKGKVFVAGYYHKALKEELQRLAKEKKISVSRLVEELLESGLKDYKRRRGDGA